MSTSLLNELEIDPKQVGQIATCRHNFISVYDLNGDVITRVFEQDSTPIDMIRLRLVGEIQSSESDPRSFINTENEDLIRCAIIGKVEHILNQGVAIYDKRKKLIHFCHEPCNEHCEDIVGQIEDYPTLPREDWNPCPMGDDPEDFIEPINWNLAHFYGYRS